MKAYILVNHKNESLDYVFKNSDTAIHFCLKYNSRFDGDDGAYYERGHVCEYTAIGNESFDD